MGVWKIKIHCRPTRMSGNHLADEVEHLSGWTLILQANLKEQVWMREGPLRKSARPQKRQSRMHKQQQSAGNEVALQTFPSWNRLHHLAPKPPSKAIAAESHVQVSARLCEQIQPPGGSGRL